MVRRINHGLRYIRKNSTEEEKAVRLSTLTDTEKEAYKLKTPKPYGKKIGAK